MLAVAWEMTPKQEKFCLEYIECGNASEAYRQAYDAKNMSAETVHVKACETLKKDKIAVRIAELQKVFQERNEVTVDNLVKELEADRRLARQNKQTSAAISATLNIGRLHGLADRGRPIKIGLPKIDDINSALAATAAVIEGVAKGELTPDEGKAVSGLVEAYRRMIETVELERRISNIEEKIDS